MAGNFGPPSTNRPPPPLIDLLSDDEEIEIFVPQPTLVKEPQFIGVDDEDLWLDNNL